MTNVQDNWTELQMNSKTLQNELDETLEVVEYFRFPTQNPYVPTDCELVC